MKDKETRKKSKKNRWKRRVLAVCLVLVLIPAGYIGIIFGCMGKVEPKTDAVTTNAESSQYTLEEFSERLQPYSGLYEEAVLAHADEPDSGTYVIPGLESARTLLDNGAKRFSVCTGMTPQGIAVSGQYLFISAYCQSKNHNSVIFVVDKERDGDRIISSTYIREVLAEGNIKKANELLGYCYFVSGRVVHGNSIGHSRLYPTANLLPPKEKHLPKYGVYVSRVTAAGRIFAGLTNVGRKPTIEGDNPAGVETYLYDFAGNLYGMQIKVELLDFVRPEKQFDSIEDLKRQLDHDVAVCKERYLALTAGLPEMIGRGKF